MKRAYILIIALAVLIGGCMAIKAFDEYGLKELNNRLTTFDKLISKLQKGVVISSAYAAEDEFLIPVSVVGEEEIDPTPDPTEPEPEPKELTKREIRLAKIAAKKAERKKRLEELKAQREERRNNRRNKNATTTIMAGSDTGYKEVKVATVNPTGIMQTDGRIDLYDRNTSESIVVNIAPTSKVGQVTQAKIAIPSSYFLDLRGIFKSNTTQQYTADVLILHDANGNTVTLSNVDETNNISTAGPVAGGRDQSAAFSDSTWIHVFIIYNPTTGDVSSVSSSSATAPTLTGALIGYTFYVRVGALFVYDAGGGLGIYITRSYQMGDRVTYNTNWIKWDANNDSYTSIDLAAVVPATAKLVHGTIGLSAGTTARKMAVASDSGGLIKVGAICDAQGTGDTNYGVSGSKNFTLPLITGQTIWWKTETTNNIYAVGIEGFTDDL